MATSPILSSTVLGKRQKNHENSMVLYLESSSDACTAPSDSDADVGHPQSKRPMLVNGSLVPATSRPYKCTFEGCDKAYKKPSRLEEHERCHTGTVPFLVAFFFGLFTSPLASVRVRDVWKILLPCCSLSSSCEDSPLGRRPTISMLGS